MSSAAQASINDQMEHWQRDFVAFAEDCLKIRTKSGTMSPLALNKAQKYLHERLERQRYETGKVRAIILKGRQQGCSTYVEGRYYWRSIFRIGVRAFILAHEKESTSAIYEMAQRYHDHCPIAPSTGTSNAKELVFDRLDSGYRIGTAGNESVGRGTTIQYFHGSEVAFWAERNTSQLSSGIIQAIPDEDDTEIIYESTANGVGNFFHHQTMRAMQGQGEFQLIFIPWYWQDEYVKPVPEGFLPTEYEAHLLKRFGDDGLTPGHIMWRRNKVLELTSPLVDGEKKFKQEYPCDVNEAFQVTGEGGFISPDAVQKARSMHAPRGNVLVVGVDPSRGGDRFAIIRRAGRQMYKPETHAGEINLGRAVRICRKILDEENPERMFIDAGGGADLVDRLHELGYTDVVRAVNFGGKALDPNRYKNKRAEMWADLALWLQTEDLDVQLPDSDELQADLCTPMAHWDSADRMVLESKEHIRRVRKLPSPDLGDAAALTFAEQVFAGGVSPSSFEPDYDFID